MAVAISALISTLILVMFQRWVVSKTHSQAIRADMLHYQSDVLMNGAIVVALALSWYGMTYADALFAFGIGIYILISAIRMGHEAVQSLLDRALPEEDREQIIRVIRDWPGVCGAHDFRTRQSAASCGNSSVSNVFRIWNNINAPTPAKKLTCLRVMSCLKIGLVRCNIC